MTTIGSGIEGVLNVPLILLITLRNRPLLNKMTKGTLIILIKLLIRG